MKIVGMKMETLKTVNKIILKITFILSLFLSFWGFTQNNIELNTILKQLKLTKKQCELSLIVAKPFPNNKNETIVVIPEIAKEENGYYEFHSHVLIVDTKTNKIIHKYYESAEDNDWISDAVMLAEIKIDTAPYMVSKNNRAFGVRVYVYNQSKPNPYSRESMSLFIKKTNVLNKVLDNHTMMEYSGEGDASCYGEFLRSEKIFIMTSNKTNGYYDVLVKNKLTSITNNVDKNGKCISENEVSLIKSTLKFDGYVYKKI